VKSLSQQHQTQQPNPGEILRAHTFAKVVDPPARLALLRRDLERLQIRQN